MKVRLLVSSIKSLIQDSRYPELLEHLESYGSDIIDEGLQEYLGTTLGDSAWIDSCPFSDNDQMDILDRLQ